MLQLPLSHAASLHSGATEARSKSRKPLESRRPVQDGFYTATGLVITDPWLAIQRSKAGRPGKKNKAQWAACSAVIMECVGNDVHSSDDRSSDDGGTATPRESDSGLSGGSVHGQVVWIRRSSARLTFVDVIETDGGRGGRRVEIVVRAPNVPKAVKLGDQVSASGAWEDDAATTLRMAVDQLPTVTRKRDPRAPFTPVPAPGRHGAAPSQTHCRFWLSERRCNRNPCRYRHAELGSDEFRQGNAEQ